MAKKQVTREITIEICDFCQQECKESPDKCGFCKRVGHSTHMAYTLEVYRYYDHKRRAGFGRHICQGCANELIDMRLGTLLDSMIGN